jgi:hypothetical protein
MSDQIVKLHVREDATDPPQHALNDLRAALDDAAGLEGPDEDGIIEVTVDADDEDDAIKTVIDAIAAAGADDHFEIAEHP